MAFTSFRGPDFRFESISPDAGPLPTQLVAWHRRAVAAGRVPVVYLTAGWCPPSVLLEKSLGDPRMQRALRDVDAATFNIDVWADDLKAAGFQAHTVPIFFIIDAAGRPVGPTLTGAAWGENTPDNMAPPLERFFDPARAARPTPVPSAARPFAIIAVLLALVLVIAAVIWKVIADGRQQQAEDADARQRELQQQIDRSIRSSLDKQ